MVDALFFFKKVISQIKSVDGQTQFPFSFIGINNRLIAKENTPTGEP
jgi:hypothetical protein